MPGFGIRDSGFDKAGFGKTRRSGRYAASAFAYPESRIPNPGLTGSPQGANP